MKILVVGPNGTIGKEVANLLKNNGHEVIGASRSTTPALDIAKPESIDNFYKNLGEVDAIICVAGDAAFAALNTMTNDQIQLSVNSKLLGQVNLVRKGLNNLRAGGIFIITGGTLAYSPMLQTSLLAMVNAGLEGFARAVALELTENRRIVIVHPAWVAETAAKMGSDPSPWPDAIKTAQTYLNALKGTKNGEPVFVEGYIPENKF